MPIPPVLAMIRRRIDATAAAVPGLIVSADYDFLAGLIHTCAVQYDANAAGGTVGPGGAPRPDWQPVVGLEEVACRIVWKASSSSESPGKPGEIRTGRVLFGQSIVADRRNRLVYTDPDTGATDYAYLVGPVRNAHMQNHHWIADIQDHTLA